MAAFFLTPLPLGIASRVYITCNNYRSHLVPYVMGGYYSTWLTHTDSLHRAQYYNVKDGRILWINRCNHSQFETVDPCESELFYLVCRTIGQSQALNMETLQFVMQRLREEAAI